MANNVILTASYGIANVIIPRKGPRVAPITLDFAAYNSIQVDSTLMFQQGHLEFIQGAYIDNGDNPNQLYVTVEVTQQRIIIAPFTQGYYALLAVSPTVIDFVTPSAPDRKVPVHFYNVPIQATTWKTQ